MVYGVIEEEIFRRFHQVALMSLRFWLAEFLKLFHVEYELDCGEYIGGATRCKEILIEWSDSLASGHLILRKLCYTNNASSSQPGISARRKGKCKTSNNLASKKPMRDDFKRYSMSCANDLLMRW